MISSLQSISDFVGKLEAMKSPPPKKRRTETQAWADRHKDDRVDEVTWEDDDQSLTPPPKLTESSEKVISSALTRPLANDERRRIRKEFPTPDLSKTRCPLLDGIFKASSIKKETKDTDGELARIQAFTHDPRCMGPLITLLHDMEEDVGAIIRAGQSSHCKHCSVVRQSLCPDLSNEKTETIEVCQS